MIKKYKLKRKKLSSNERKNSFGFLAPVTGRLLPLDFSNDVIMRRGDLGIGFTIDNFEEKIVVSPVTGMLFDTFDMGTGISIFNEKEEIYTIIKISGNNELIKNQGIQLLIQEENKLIKEGDSIFKLSRKLLTSRGYEFQVTITFSQLDLNMGEEPEYKYDMLYTFIRNSKNNVEQHDLLGYVYRVEENKVLDID